jgi:glucose-6-phosphate isomerase
MKQLHIEIPKVTTDIQTEIQKNLKKLGLVQKQIETEAEKNLQTPYAFACAIDDKASITHIQKTVDEKKKLNPSILIIIGIGGSNLGTLAVQEALLGRLYNESTQGLKIYYADTVDSDYICSILELTENTLKKGANILLNVISKSGNTTEPIAIFELFLAQLKQYRPDTYMQYIICTTDTNSPLHTLANQNKWTTLEIPKYVGGRYSVFTAVGLFPLGMLGIDTKLLLQGARDMRTLCLQEEGSLAAQTAAWLFALMQKGYTVTNLFLFSNELRGCGAWWRQLVGESLGKAQTRDSAQNKLPIVPTISIGTTDLHSVGQLYFADVIKIATQFVAIKKDLCSLTVPYYQEFETLVPHIQQKTVSHIMYAITSGVQKAYAQKEMPFCTVTLPEKNAYYIGQFLLYKMFETVYLAHLLNVDAFDQPEVEIYKKEVRAILARK